MFQRWHHNPRAVRPCWNLFKTRRSCFSVAYTQVPSANRARCIPGAAWASCMYKLYSTVARTEPCGTPEPTFLGDESLPSTETFNFLLVKKEAINLMRLIENCNSDSLYSRPHCHVMSKAFSISKNTAAVDILLLKFRETWSVSLIHWSFVLWRARKTNWLALESFFPQCVYELLYRIRLIGHTFWGNFWFLLGFGRAMILASSKVPESDKVQGSD
jgi:hypothetical protein